MKKECSCHSMKKPTDKKKSMPMGGMKDKMKSKGGKSEKPMMGKDKIKGAGKKPSFPPAKPLGGMGMPPKMGGLPGMM